MAQWMFFFSPQEPSPWPFICTPLQPKNIIFPFIQQPLVKQSTFLFKAALILKWNFAVQRKLHPYMDSALLRRERKQFIRLLILRQTNTIRELSPVPLNLCLLETIPFLIIFAKHKGKVGIEELDQCS